jgi:beta-glucosidase
VRGWGAAHLTPRAGRVECRWGGRTRGERRNHTGFGDGSDTGCLTDGPRRSGTDSVPHRVSEGHRLGGPSGRGRGLIIWCFQDNFASSMGYPKRFGLVWTDFATQQRIPKQSALWYRDAIATNGLSATT